MHTQQTVHRDYIGFTSSACQRDLFVRMEKLVVEVTAAVVLSVLSLLFSLLGVYVSVISHLKMKRVVMDTRTKVLQAINNRAHTSKTWSVSKDYEQLERFLHA